MSDVNGMAQIAAPTSTDCARRPRVQKLVGLLLPFKGVVPSEQVCSDVKAALCRDPNISSEFAAPTNGAFQCGQTFEKTGRSTHCAPLS